MRRVALAVRALGSWKGQEVKTEPQADVLSWTGDASKRDGPCTEVTLLFNTDESKEQSETNGKLLLGEVCKLSDSPSRILRVAESGNLREFENLYQADTNRLQYRDSRGRTALHHAVGKDRLAIAKYILEKGGDLDVKDDEGNTALHVAVCNESMECLVFLLLNGANSSILNNDMNGPIHLATEFNKVEVLKEMLKNQDRVDAGLRGKHGRSALHLAAIYDHSDCARLLLQLGCCPKTPCDNGYYPIHEAAKNASASTLQVILEWGESLGYKREDTMKLFDADGNVPLHSAVHAGDIKAVQLCLESGALISTQQHDLSTPVHLACAQGALEIVRLMFGAQPQEKDHCLSIGDAQQMTPLHCAAMFDHPELVEYLVAEGAEMNATDKEGRSVLLLGAARGAWQTISSLLSLGASIAVRDKAQRNLLHHIVLSGGCLDDFAADICQMGSEIGILLNERDFLGCTPMHYASRNGHLKTIQSLLRLGAIINLKNNENQSPLHFAARYGRYNTVRQLLESRKGHLIMNELDGGGLTALHIASLNGHRRVVQLLLLKGALLHRDHKGRTPLHYASMNGYTHTMDQLLAVHSHLLDQTDRDGNTALHLACMQNQASAVSLLLGMGCGLIKNQQELNALDVALHYKHAEVALAMVTHPTRSQEVMRARTSRYGCLSEGLTAVMPEVMMALLDTHITRSKVSEDSKSYYIKYNFQYLEDRHLICPLQKIQMNEPITPLPVLNLMVRYGREELLSHPLCVKYLESKWNSYGMYFHLMNLAVYTVFLLFITINAVSLMNRPGPHTTFQRSNYTYLPTGVDEQDQLQTNSSKESVCSVTSVVVLSFVLINIFKEFFQMYQQRVKYFLDIINALEWVLYLSAAVSAIGILLPNLMWDSSEYIASAIAVFLAWFNYLLYLQRFNRVGLYVVMFLEILSTLLKVMVVFSVLFIAFGLSFHILLARVEALHDKGFRSPGISLLRVSTMMMGEMDFLGTFLRPLASPSTLGGGGAQMLVATCFLICFLILMPILLMNLLIGLAVGDIETVRRNAQLKRLTMQVDQHTDLERKLPKRFLQLCRKKEIYEYPNRKCASSYVWTTIRGWFTSPDQDQGSFGTPSRCYRPMSHPVDSPPEDVYEELYRQRKKLKELRCSADHQLQLLRLIVQKMEIRTENDDMDEGHYDKREACHLKASAKHSEENEEVTYEGKWRSPGLQRKLRSITPFLSKNRNRD